MSGRLPGLTFSATTRAIWRYCWQSFALEQRINKWHNRGAFAQQQQDAIHAHDDEHWHEPEFLSYPQKGPKLRQNAHTAHLSKRDPPTPSIEQSVGPAPPRNRHRPAFG